MTSSATTNRATYRRKQINSTSQQIHTTRKRNNRSIDVSPQQSLYRRTPLEPDPEDTLRSYMVKQQTYMRWFVLLFAALLTLLLIGADSFYAFINHNLYAFVPSPLIAGLWFPMVRHLFPSRAKAKE